MTLVSATAFSGCSIWYGPWFTDTQNTMFKKMNDPNAEMPDFWTVSISNINYKSPVIYTLLSLIGGLVSGIGVIQSAFRLEELEEREGSFRNEQERHAETMELYYKALKDHLIHFFCHQIDKFDGDTCRASVYRHDEESKKFRMIFRHSNITHYAKDGRVSLPENEGVIGGTYLNGDSVYIFDLPPKTNKQLYLQETNNQLNALSVSVTMPKVTLNKLSMPSRCLYGYAIRDSNGIKIAVVIIESTEPLQFVKSELDNTLSARSHEISKYVQHMARIDTILNPYGVA